MSDTTKLGILLNPEHKPQRDAIHIAVAPMRAKHQLVPGEHVGISHGEASESFHPHIGVVDPFLRRLVKAGEMFYLCLYQQTVTGMRHHWKHPSFPDIEPRDDSQLEYSRQWLEQFARKCGITYNELMQGADKHDLCLGDDDAYDWWDDEFWVHYKAVTGKHGEGSFFRCAC